MNKKDGKQNKTVKIHRQFEHHNSKKIRDSEIEDKEIEEELKAINKSCEICLRYKKSKLKPVGLPMAKSFNGTVAMDLKQ